MADVELAQTSNSLFIAAFVLYAVATLTAFFRLAFTRVSPGGVLAPTPTGRRAGAVSTLFVVVGAAAHLGSVVSRGLAAGRPPWMNMYEYSSLFALLAVVAGFIVLRRTGYANLMGFVLAAAMLMMGSALLLYAEAGPVVPALDTWWRLVHVTMMVLASAIFTVGFAATALYLLKDVAERRVADRSGTRYSGSTVGAAGVPVDDLVPEGAVDVATDADVVTDADEEMTSPLAQRATLSPFAFAAVPFAAAGGFALLIGGTLLDAAVWAAALGALGASARWAVPFLPPAASLDNLAYRINAFAFPVFTFGVILGAVWAEVAWGRYWGWDPKETGSFFTWVLYAGYLHARSTRGWQGRRAAWVNVVAYGALLVTYFVVNLVVSGLHSYAGVG